MLCNPPGRPLRPIRDEPAATQRPRPHRLSVYPNNLPERPLRQKRNPAFSPVCGSSTKHAGGRERGQSCSIATTCEGGGLPVRCADVIILPAPGRSAAWSARQFWELEAASSNLAAPTMNQNKTVLYAKMASSDSGGVFAYLRAQSRVFGGVIRTNSCGRGLARMGTFSDTFSPIGGFSLNPVVEEGFDHRIRIGQ